ncbi:Indoleamine 2,3-dioxygenase [Dentipellis sp. KUC8613]|nr:Indoleamine 2,3-dioxygenase [Dentipellis sp. KUC8613]
MDVLNNTVFAHTVIKPRKMLDMEEYDIDGATGFFPSQSLPRLTGQFEFWERALDDAKRDLSLGDDDRDEARAKRANGEIWRAGIRSWPVLDTSPLEADDRLLKRAHMVLAFLINFFVHSQPPTDACEAIHVPACLAIPIVKISRVLDIAPVLTFADTVLWNWAPIDPDLPLSANNVRFMHTFSGTDTEHNFYVTSAKAEIRGVEFLRIIDSYVNQLDVTAFASASRTAKDLMRLAAVIQDLTEIMQSVRETVDPYTFYWQVRPWYNGSDSKGPDAPGWIYDGVPDSEHLLLSGPSAGQSTVMHALDVFLNVDHKLQQKRCPAPSESNKRADKGFMERMRQYMPGKHRQFLLDLSSIPTSIRDLAKDTALMREPFDGAVLALKKFRDVHIRIACLYIVSMSNSEKPGGTSSDQEEDSGSKRKGGPVRGTGGNELSVLLKAGRDATNRTMLSRN